MHRVIACTLLLFIAPLVFADGIIKKSSEHSVSQTLDKLVELVIAKGFTVAARIDHAAAAARVGLELRPTELLIFGNPKVGTQLMLSEQSVGLDLPIRVLAWEKADGSVWIAYHTPKNLLATHDINDRAEIQHKMTNALHGLTDAATQ